MWKDETEHQRDHGSNLAQCLGHVTNPLSLHIFICKMGEMTTSEMF